MPDAARDNFVFVSHASQDRSAAEALVTRLESAGLTCWIAPRDVQPGGRDYTDQIHGAIQRARAFVICLSDAANHSIFVRAETEIAFSRCPIFPVRLENVLPEGGLALFLRLNQWTDSFGRGAAHNLVKLVKSLGETMNQPVGEPSEKLGVPTSPSDDAAAAAVPPPLSEEEAQRAFVGPNAARLFSKWRIADLRQRKINWSVAAFLFGFCYLLFRKMWMPALLVFGLSTVIAAFGIHAAVVHETVFVALCAGLWLAMSVALGVRADDLYRAHSLRQCAQINRAGAHRQVTLDMLATAGGVSWSAAIVASLTWGFLLLMLCGAIANADGSHVGGEASPAANDMSADNAMVDAADAMNVTDPADNMSGNVSNDPSAAAPPPVPAAVQQSTYYVYCVRNQTARDIVVKIRAGDIADWASAIIPQKSMQAIYSKSSETPEIQFYTNGETNATGDQKLKLYNLKATASAAKDSCGQHHYSLVETDGLVDLSEDEG